MANSKELKELLLGIGVEAEVVNTVTPPAALSQYNFDSLDWPAVDQRGIMTPFR